MSFAVIETGLLLRGVPYTETVRVFARKGDADRYAAKRMALKASFLVNACVELRSALRVTVSPVVAA